MSVPHPRQCLVHSLPKVLLKAPVYFIFNLTSESAAMSNITHFIPCSVKVHLDLMGDSAVKCEKRTFSSSEGALNPPLDPKCT